MKQMFSDFGLLGAQFCDPQEKENTCSQTYNYPFFSRRKREEIPSGVWQLWFPSVLERDCCSGYWRHLEVAKQEFQRGRSYTERQDSRNVHRGPIEFLLNTEACMQNTKLH